MYKLFSSLRTKFVVLVVAILVVTLGIMTYSSVRSQNRIFSGDLIEKGRLLGFFASRVLPESIIAYDFTTLNQVMQDLTSQKDMVYSVVIAANKSPMSSYIDLENSYIVSTLKALKVVQFKQDVWFDLIKVLKMNQALIHFSFPVKSNDDVLAVLKIGLSKDRINALSKQSWAINLLGNAFIIIFLSLCIYTVFKISALKPIQCLISAAERVARGQLDQPIVVSSTDELGQLSASFNAMMENLRSSINEKDQAAMELWELNKTLEERVESRTHALADSEAYSRAILDTVGEGIMTIDRQGFITSINSTAERDFRASQDELIGLHSSMLLADRHWSDSSESQGYQDEVNGPFGNKNLGQRIDYEGVRSDGESFSLECIVTQVNHQNESVRVVILQDVTYRRDLETKLSDAAHKSGMAEIATGVLHNIGNVLNSANVAGEEILSITCSSKVDGLLKANALLLEHSSNIGEFFQNDPKGRLLTDYYVRLGEQIKAENETIGKEAVSLQEKIEMMREVISTQQSYASSGFYAEKIGIEVLVNDSIRVLESSLFKRNVKIFKQFDNIPQCLVQKSKLIQVITNLLKNAIEAVDHNDLQDKQKEIHIAISKESYGCIKVEISDNGVGISKENQNNIFRHGFTTKPTGHGFGLHTCANSMTEMGGSLTVYSEGAEKGAKFTLIVPVDCTLEDKTSQAIAHKNTG